MEIIDKLNAVNAHLEVSGSEVRYWFTNGRFYICGNALSDADDISEVKEERILRDFEKLPVTEDFLLKEGFRRDTTAPKSVLRYEKYDGTIDQERTCNRTFYASLTMDENLDRTLYGFILFHHPDWTEHKHKFDGLALNVGQYKKFMDRNCNYRDLPAGIKTYPYDPRFDDLY